MSLPLHINPLGLGSHSPFPVQVAELDPLSTSPGGQLKVIVLPSTGTKSSSNPKTFGTESLHVGNNIDSGHGYPQ